MILFCQARASLIDKQYEADREKLHKIRLLLVRSLIFWKKNTCWFWGILLLSLSSKMFIYMSNYANNLIFVMVVPVLKNAYLHVLFSNVNFPNMKTFKFYLTLVYTCTCITFFSETWKKS